MADIIIAVGNATLTLVPRTPIRYATTSPIIGVPAAALTLTPLAPVAPTLFLTANLTATATLSATALISGGSFPVTTLSNTAAVSGEITTAEGVNLWGRDDDLLLGVSPSVAGYLSPLTFETNKDVVSVILTDGLIAVHRHDGSVTVHARNLAGEAGYGTTDSVYGVTWGGTTGAQWHWVQVRAVTVLTYVGTPYNALVGLRDDGTLWMAGEGADILARAGVVTGLSSGAGGYYSTSLIQMNPEALQNLVGFCVGPDWGYAILSSGNLLVWGMDTAGQLGMADTGDKLYPVLNPDFEENVWKVAGAGHVGFVITADGSLWAAGDNSNGQIGVGSANASFSIFQQIPGRWLDVQTDGECVAGIKSDGTLWTWGYQYSDDTLNDAPVLLDADTDWVEVGVAGVIIARKSTGTLWSMHGKTSLLSSGILGDGTTSQNTTKTQIGTYAVWRAIAKTTTTSDSLRGAILGGTDIVDSYIPIAALAIDVQEAYTPEAQIAVSVEEYYTPSAILGVNVHTRPDIGGIPILVDTWDLSVTIAGVDVSDTLVGEVTVDIEEGASRLATFTMALSGVVSPTSWIGSPVVIRYKEFDSDGLTLMNQIVFTGVIDEPELLPDLKQVKCSCTDNMTATYDKLPPEITRTLVPGTYYSDWVFSSETGWESLEDAMRTIPASLDLSAEGVPRVTYWDTPATYLVITDDDINDESLSVSLGRRTDIINRVNISFEYRYYILKERHFTATWSFKDMPFWVPRPYSDMVDSALEQTGWVNYREAKRAETSSTMWGTGSGGSTVGFFGSTPTSEGSGAFTSNSTSIANTTTQVQEAPTKVDSFTVDLAKRYSQPVKEAYSFVVVASNSIAGAGEIAVSESYSGEAEFDTNTWENSFSTLPEVTYTNGRRQLGTATTDTLAVNNRTAMQNAMLTALNKARTDIVRSHRINAVTFDTSLNLNMDVINGVDLQAVDVQAKGKIGRVKHTFNLTEATAISSVEVRLFHVASGAHVNGSGPITTVPATPAAPTSATITAPKLGSYVRIFPSPTAIFLFPGYVIGDEGTANSLGYGYSSNQPDWSKDGWAAWVVPEIETTPSLDANGQPEVAPDGTQIVDVVSTTMAVRQSQFKITAPAIPDSDVNEVEKAVAAITHTVTIPNEPFTITL